MRQGQNLEAAEEALTAVGLLHHYPQAHYHLGQALTELGELERARIAFQVCSAMAPSHEGVAARLAELEERIRGLAE